MLKRRHQLHAQRQIFAKLGLGRWIVLSVCQLMSRLVIFTVIQIWRLSLVTPRETKRPQRVSARTNDVEAGKARRRLGRAGRPRVMNC